jgi:UDP-2-acetamido-3-amino-2,3-dideoxy-glucuronate N-acetyltransferase
MRSIHETAVIHPMAHVEACQIGARTVVRQFASVTGGTVLGADCSVSPGAMLHGPVIGNFSRVSGGVMMGPGFLIGRGVFIGPNVTLCNDAWPRAYKDGYDPEVFDGTRWAVIVEDGASIGAGAVILPGVRIGKDAMVGAGAVVRHNLPAGHVMTADGSCWPIGDKPRERMRFAC